MLYTLLIVGFLMDRPVTVAITDLTLLECAGNMVDKVELALTRQELELQYIGCEVQRDDETKKDDSTGAVGL